MTETAQLPPDDGDPMTRWKLAHRMLHVAWTAHAGSQGYQKGPFMDLANALERLKPGDRGPERFRGRDVPHPATFVGCNLECTFGKREAESMAQQIVSFCADAGTWELPLFQCERLARLADLVDSFAMNNGSVGYYHRRGLDHLRPRFVDDKGVTLEFVERVAECAGPREHPIYSRIHAAVAEIFKVAEKEATT